METSNFPGCCTASIIFDLHGSEECLIKRISDSITMAKLAGLAVLVAITSNIQKDAEKALRMSGFKSTRPMTKSAHPDTTIRLWHLKMEEIKEI